MAGKTRRWWPVCKALVSLAILFYLGRSFAHDLARPDLWDHPLQVGWLVPAGLLYLAGMSLSALYWRGLLFHFGQRPPLVAALRAYFVGQLGKYVPGKALALVLRAALLRRQGILAGLALLTAFYEVLTTMAAGALTALLLLLALGPSLAIPSVEAWTSLWTALRDEQTLPHGTELNLLVLVAVALSALMLVPIVPVVFNRLVKRLPFRARMHLNSPQSASEQGPAPFRTAWLLEGLLLTSFVWPMFGVALAMALQAVPGAALPWDLPTLAWLSAVMALSYVAGFVVLISPGALGVREAILVLLLVPDLTARHDADPAVARGKVLLAVLLLRLAWTTAEVLAVFVFWILDWGVWMDKQPTPAPPAPLQSG